MAKLEQEAYLNIAVPKFLHAAVHAAASQHLTNAASYCRQALVRQLKQDGMLEPEQHVLRA
jgi:hypothetical protein